MYITCKLVCTHCTVELAILDTLKCKHQYKPDTVSQSQFL